MGRFITARVHVAVAGVLVACGGGTSPDAVDAVASTCKVEPPAACRTPSRVATAKDIIAAASALGWQGTEGIPRVGDDLLADADLELRADAIAPPAESCRSLPCKPTSFAGARAYPRGQIIDGVICVDAACAAVTIAKGTRFRLMLVLSTPLPPSATYPIGQFVEPCAEGCGGAEGVFLCPATHVCLTAAQLCRSCEGHDANYCQCRNDDCTMQPTGTKCEYIRGDFGQRGTCTADKGCVLQE